MLNASFNCVLPSCRPVTAFLESQDDLSTTDHAGEPSAMHRRVLLLLAGLLLTTFIVLTSLGVGLSVALAQWHNEDKQRQKVRPFQAWNRGRRTPFDQLAPRAPASSYDPVLRPSAAS